MKNFNNNENTQTSTNIFTNKNSATIQEEKLETAIKKRFKLPMVILIVLICVLSLGITGFALQQTVFNQPKGVTRILGLNTGAQDSILEKHTNVYDYEKTVDGVTVKLEGILSDGCETYVVINAYGEPLNTITPDTSDNYIIDRMKEAKMEDEHGNKWAYRADRMNAIVGGFSYSGNSATKSETTIVFLGGPKADTTVTFSIEFYEIGTTITFENVDVKVTPNTRRDLRDENYTVTVPQGLTGKITEILHTPLRTEFTVDWGNFYDDDLDVHSEGELDNYRIKLTSGDTSSDLVLTPDSRGNPGIYPYLNALNPKDEIKLDLFYEYYDGETPPKFIKNLVTIPGE
jgi:hypothetical protein